MKLTAYLFYFLLLLFCHHQQFQSAAFIILLLLHILFNILFDLYQNSSSGYSVFCWFR